jgi:hypothetical protein
VVKCGCLGGISETPLLPLRGESVSGMYVYRLNLTRQCSEWKSSWNVGLQTPKQISGFSVYSPTNRAVCAKLNSQESAIQFFYENTRRCVRYWYAPPAQRGQRTYRIVSSLQCMLQAWKQLLKNLIYGVVLWRYLFSH